MPSAGTSISAAAKEFGEHVCREVAALVGQGPLTGLLSRSFKPQDIILENGEVHIVSQSPETLLPELLKALGEQLRVGFGAQLFETVIERAWKRSRGALAADVLVRLLELIPADYLVEEKVKFLSRENLESLALQKTEELRAINTGLEGTVRQRTEALTRTNEELQKSKLELETQLKAVAAEKERIEAIVTSIGEGVLVVNPVGSVFLCNHAAETLLGYPKEQLVGKSLETVFTPEGGVDSPFASLLEILSVRKTLTVSEASYKRPDGNSLVLALTGTPVVLDDDLVGGIVVFHDITAQKLTEAAKQQFISIAAHQLRTPLSGIKWALSMLLNGSLGELPNQPRVLVMKSFESTNRLIGLVNDLLDVDHIETGRRRFTAVPTNAFDLLRNVLFDLTPQVSHKRLKIKLNPVADLPPILADQEGLRAVFQNLLENAIRYTREEGTITVSAQATADAVVVSVADTGIGIPYSQQKSIFTRFFRAGNAVAAEPDGSGLGLYIAKLIVDQHDGKLWFESAEGKGTTFFVSFPSAPRPGAVPPAPAAAPAPQHV